MLILIFDLDQTFGDLPNLWFDPLPALSHTEISSFCSFRLLFGDKPLTPLSTDVIYRSPQDLQLAMNHPASVVLPPSVCLGPVLFIWIWREGVRVGVGAVVLLPRGPILFKESISRDIGAVKRPPPIIGHSVNCMMATVSRAGGMTD